MRLVIFIIFQIFSTNKFTLQKKGTQCNGVVVCELLPSLYMKRREGLEGSLTCEELEATLCILDPLHTEEPDQEVEAVHKE